MPDERRSKKRADRRSSPGDRAEKRRRARPVRAAEGAGGSKRPGRREPADEGRQSKGRPGDEGSIGAVGLPARSFEAEVLPGLADLAASELREAGAKVSATKEDAIPFVFTGPDSDLLALRRSVAVYRVLTFDVPRPKALLGHQHFTRLVELVTALQRSRPFEGFRFGAAGSGSPVFGRLAAALEKATGLERDDEGELLLRFRPAAAGWEVLVRLTPRPLSARTWRRCNMPGGLNATVAASGLALLGSSAKERHLNLMCGSGTLLIERALSGRWERGIGIDIDAKALECARVNVEAAGLGGRVELVEGDAVDLPFPDRSFDRLSADLPWGDAVGRHEANALLYPAFLEESARVAAASARMLAITHEIRLFERTLANQSAWQRRGEPLRVFHGGHRPGLYLLERAGAGG